MFEDFQWQLHPDETTRRSTHAPTNVSRYQGPKTPSTKVTNFKHQQQHGEQRQRDTDSVRIHQLNHVMGPRFLDS